MDVSNNRRVNQYPESNAEYLASLLPDSLVVKGFNVISAWTLQQSCHRDSSTQVHKDKSWTRMKLFTLFLVLLVNRGFNCLRLRHSIQCSGRLIGCLIVKKNKCTID